MTDARQSLAGTLALIAATLGLLLLGAVADREEVDPDQVSTGATASAKLDPEELARLGAGRTPRVAREVERIRRLRFERVPEPQLSTTERLRRVVERGTARPEVARELAAAEIGLRILGLVEPSESFDEIVNDYGSAAAAYYESKNESLYLVGDAVPAGPELVEFVLAHELTHALEDQAFGLPDRESSNDDRSLATAALTEGTATNVMEEYAVRFLDPLALLGAATAVEDPSAGLPRFALAEIDFVYQEGASFIAALRRFGDWKLVDYALRDRPPVSTEQVLHPEKYVTGELPGRSPELAGPGLDWRPLDSSGFGEFATRELLEEGVDATTARTAAAGWSADRYKLWRREGANADCVDDCALGHALGVAWRWDTARDAREFATALRTYIIRGLDGEATDGVFALPAGMAAVRARGSEVRLGIGGGLRTAIRLASVAS